MTEIARVATVWSQNGCTYCTMAKNLLRAKNYTVDERMIGGGVWTKQDLLEVVPDARSVPQIFVEGEYIPRGYEGLKEYFSD